MSLTALAFLVLFVGVAVLAFARHPIYGLYLYVAVFYLHPPSRWWAEGLPDLRWALLAAGITLAAIFLQKNRIKASLWSKGPALLFLLYVAYMYIQTPWALDPEEHRFALAIYTKYLVVIYMIHSLVDTRERLAGFLLAHALGCLYLGYVAWTVGGGGRLDGVGGPGIDDANTLAMQLATGIYAAAAYYFAESSRWRYVALLIVPFALNGLIMAGSRGGFLALIAGGLTFFLLRPPKTLRTITIYALAGIALLTYVASDFFLERMETITVAVDDHEQVDGSIATRLLLFEAQWRMALAHPLGGGHAATTALSFQYIPVEYHSGEFGRSSHNTFMSALVDQGFPGLIAWITIAALIWASLQGARREANSRSDFALAWLCAGTAAMFVTVLVAGMFAPLIRQEIYVWILGIACCLGRFKSDSSAARTTESFATQLRPSVKHALRS